MALLQGRMVLLKRHHLLDAFQKLLILQQKPLIPLCQTQTYHLLGFNHQQPLWDSYHRYTKKPPLTPLVHTWNLLEHNCRASIPTRTPHSTTSVYEKSLLYSNQPYKFTALILEVHKEMSYDKGSRC